MLQCCVELELGPAVPTPSLAGCPPTHPPPSPCTPHPTPLLLQLMTPAAVLSRTNGREAISRGDVEEAHTLFRWAKCVIPALYHWWQHNPQAGMSCLHCIASSMCLIPSPCCHPGSSRDAKFSARLLMEQADKYIT
jgi:hypothetical protein